MGKINVVGTDQEELLELWEWSRREYDAANALLLTGDCTQGRSVAFHLFRGWHAMVSMFACKSGLSAPELESFTLERDSIILAPISSRRLSDWASSFASIRDAALRVPWHTNSADPDEGVLRRQVWVLGRCIRAHRPRVEEVPIRVRALRVEWRRVATAMAVLVLVVAAFDFGRRLWVSIRPSPDTEESSLTIQKDVSVSLEQVGDPKPRGYAWDGSGTVRFMDMVVVTLEQTTYSETLAVSLDGNDSYRISFRSDDETVGRVYIETSQIAGLEVYTVTIPEEAISIGFDAIMIEADVGDGSYALGHLLLDPIDDEQLTAGEVPDEIGVQLESKHGGS